jgi:D-threonate/D-erythronate kinase
MIVVIADDFSGAAELAGVSLRYGLKTTLCLGEVVDAGTDVLVVCTDSRSFNKKDAVNITAAIIQDVLKIKPGLIYKKIDSVLRGHVLEELKTQMKITGIDKVLIVPANPSLGRRISNGNYFIKNKRIHETAFANDPEFPVKSSSVKKLVGDENVYVLKHSEQLPLSGLVVGETEDERDTIAWANKITHTWLLAGAADFYTALLEKKYKWQRQEKVQLTYPHLYVCGTALEKSKQLVRDMDARLSCVLYINRQIIEDKQANRDQWLHKAGLILQEQKKAVIAFDDSIPAAASPKLLRSVMARYTRLLTEKISISELYIEGGATAAAILNELKIKTLIPVHEHQPGVVRAQHGNMFVTVKPGSYDMPKQILDLYVR